MKYENLPIFKASLDFCVYMENIVRHFDRYHKYTIGSDLRTHAKNILFLIQKANLSSENEKLAYIKKLRDRVEEVKILISLAKELKAYKSFNSYEHSTKLAINIAKQSQAWYKNYAKNMA